MERTPLDANTKVAGIAIASALLVAGFIAWAASQEYRNLTDSQTSATAHSAAKPYRPGDGIRRRMREEEADKLRASGAPQTEIDRLQAIDQLTRHHLRAAALRLASILRTRPRCAGAQLSEWKWRDCDGKTPASVEQRPDGTWAKLDAGYADRPTHAVRFHPQKPELFPQCEQCFQSSESVFPWEFALASAVPEELRRAPTPYEEMVDAAAQRLRAKKEIETATQKEGIKKAYRFNEQLGIKIPR